MNTIEYNTMPRLTQVAHEQLASAILPGDYVIDATAGNGHDTLFLAERVGRTGVVLGIDRQPDALRSTGKRLNEAGCAEQVRLALGNHADMLEFLPGNWRHRVKAVVFNLGYLPGSDKEVITTAESTREALDASLQLLQPRGVLSILVYRGHDGGHAEEEMIQAWLQQNDGAFSKVEWNDGDHPTNSSPRLLTCYR
ncbi:class I SAM-dependent methyltransferase [Cerasicoccus maritimus]|uniref:class I SAM-dependent methyltransferase n=1 Tax=Cerasicoccus maritimus TaxID=490089 RepID=UPI00285250DA|nr:class I SAM-dependent methyltransferase [Cerasicoccus maritimus]